MYWNPLGAIELCTAVSWIVTLDVLKSVALMMTDQKGKLNSNIRCIEIAEYELLGWLVQPLNSNIRCIEIAVLTLN